MSYDIITGIVDQDMKGKNGRGTVFWLEIREHEKVIERHEYGLLEVIDGRFDPEAIKKPYREANAKGEQLQKQAKQEEKAAELVKREEAASAGQTPELLKLVHDTIDAETKVIADIAKGNEKAMNALIGKITGMGRKAGLQFHPFDVMFTVKIRLQEMGVIK